MVEPYEETHQKGLITIEQNLISGGEIGDFGIQIAPDGRVWICVDGIAIIRFKPLSDELMKTLKEVVQEV